MSNQDLEKITQRLNSVLTRDSIVRQTTYNLRNQLNADRVVLYYFYRKWQGQVTFESLSNQQLSILGSTGADECFNDQYAQRYEEGRISSIPDIEIADIHTCHRDFLRTIQVRANLVVPILKSKNELWGLLIAHHCKSTRNWLPEDIQNMQKAATTLEKTAVINQN